MSKYWGNAHDIDCAALDLLHAIRAVEDAADDKARELACLRLADISERLSGIAQEVDGFEREMIHPDDYNAVLAEQEELRERVADFDRGIYTHGELLRLVA